MIEKKLESYIKLNMPEHDKTGNTSKTKEILGKHKKATQKMQWQKNPLPKLWICIICNYDCYTYIKNQQNYHEEI